MKVSDCMKREVCSIRPEATLACAAQRMWDGDLGCLPVVDSDHRVLGMITDRDICMGAYTQGKVLQDIQVACSMSKSLQVCRADDSLEEAQSLMSAHQVRRLPVVDDSMRLQGILSLGDIARAVNRAPHDSRRRLLREELARTLEAISQAPRAALRQELVQPREEACVPRLKVAANT